MSDQVIKCPECGAAIELGDALTGPIEAGIKARYAAEALVKDKEVEAKLKEVAAEAKVLAGEREALEEKVAERLKVEKKKLAGAAYEKVRAEEAEKTKALEAEIAEQGAKLKKAQGEELALRKQQRELEQKAEELELTVQQEVDKERKKLAGEAYEKARAEEAEKTKALEAEIAEQGAKLKKAQGEELALRKQQRELEQKSAELELTVERKLDAERKKIAEDAERKAAESMELKMREKDDREAALKKQLEDMKRKMEQGSQERQGEMLEEALKEVLERRFPYDRFEDVAKGKRGADILQIVYGPNGKACGKILWESKNTKEFSRPWVAKLKKDQADAGAEFAILMTVAMPREVRDFDFCDDVWITNYKSAIGLCTALRDGLIRVMRQKAVDAGQGSMKDVVYEYVTGPDFSRRIKGIVTAYTQMQVDLDSEKRSMLKIWKKREKQIGVVLGNAVEMRGEIEGLVSGYKVLPSVDELELGSIGDEDA